MRSTTSVEGRGSATSFGSRSCKRLVQTCCKSQMLERGDCEHRNFPLPVTDSVICEVCSRSSRHEEALLSVALISVPMQRGSRQCGTCSPWFASVGGLTVHRCLGKQSASASSLRLQRVSSSVHRCCPAHCSVCMASVSGRVLDIVAITAIAAKDLPSAIVRHFPSDVYGVADRSGPYKICPDTWL